jgi:hypothetical protein
MGIELTLRIRTISKICTSGTRHRLGPSHRQWRDLTEQGASNGFHRKLVSVKKVYAPTDAASGVVGKVGNSGEAHHWTMSPKAD